MVGAGDSAHWKQLAGQRAQAPLHAVADDGVADLFGDGETDADRFVAVIASTDLEDEPGSRDAPAAVGGKEVGALGKRD